MIIYDLIHGYQPFKPDIEFPKRVKKYLKEIFLPTSLAMRKGIIPRGVQLQGWTIKSWLISSGEIKKLAKEILRNLKIALKKKNIEIGISAYSHPILPMLSDDLIKAQIFLDKEIVEKYLGPATWFWPPEGAIDQKTLKIIFEIVPNLIVLIPDKSIGKENFSGPIRIKYSKGKYQKGLVFSCLLKDLFMNAEDYPKKPKYLQKIKYLSKSFSWKEIRRLVHSPKIFGQFLIKLGKEKYVLMRDWENAGSKNGLRKIAIRGKVIPKEIGNFVFLKEKIKFRLPSQFDWSKAKVFKISQILPASWDMESSIKDPFPWWLPNKKGKIWKERKIFLRKKIEKWLGIVKEYDLLFQKKVKKFGGLKKALKNKEFKKILEETFPVLHSCVAWHYFAKPAWHPDYQYSESALKNIVLPALEKMRKF